jgi:hypothetical protein
VLAAGLLPNTSATAQEGAGTTLLSYTLAGRAAPIYESYHQPAAPIPANPTQEFSIGHSQFDMDSGSGHAIASAVWPGATAANFPSALHDVDDRFPLLPNYPVRAESFFPASGTQESSAALDAGAYTMRSECGDGTATASARSTEVEGQLETGAVSSRTSGVAEGDTAVATARASVSDISLLGGLLTVSQVTTVAEASTDGKTGKVSGRTLVNGLVIQGVEMRVDSDGVHLADTEVPIPIRDVTNPLNEGLVAAGMSVFVAEPIDEVDGPNAARSLGGLIITFKPKVLAANLPPEIISQIPPQVPVFLTTFDQTITLALGGVAVRASAPPALPPPPPPPPPPPTGGGGVPPAAPGPIVSPPAPTDEGEPSPAGSSEPPAGVTLPLWMAIVGGLFAGISSRVLRHVADKALLAAPITDACPLGGS